MASLIYVMPFLAFLFVFIVCFALFSKTKILGKSDITNAIISLLIALIFVLNPPASKFTVATVPWVAVLMFVLVFIMLILAFVRGKVDDLVKSKIVAAILIGVILIIFLAAALNVFGPLISTASSGELVIDSEINSSLGVFLNPTIIGGVVILLIAGSTYWFLAKKDK